MSEQVSKGEDTASANISRLLEGKVCIVTGAGRGIGREIARRFAECGAIVYANELREGSVEEWLTEEPMPISGRIVPTYFDVADESAAKATVMRIKREAGRIDALVNNAGIEFNELIGMIDRSHMELMFRVNVFGCINMTELASRVMARNPEGGSIVNIASMTALRGNAGQGVYSATKGAVVSFTKSAAKELAHKGIRVNAVAPGLVDTEMMRQANPDKLAGRIANICMGRLAEPDDIANACLFLASDLSSYVSGQVLGVEGCTIM